MTRPGKHSIPKPRASPSRRRNATPEIHKIGASFNEERKTLKEWLVATAV